MRTTDGQFELNLIIGDRAITEYAHEGNVFVEGRKGSEFQVEFKNHGGGRVLVVPAVDGKSVLDGKPATPDSKGYVVKAGETLRIPGWTLDSAQAAKFTFEDKDKSYAALTSTTTSVQAGVVGVLVFQEKVEVKAEPPKEIHHHHFHPVITPTPAPVPGPWDPWVPRNPWNIPTVKPYLGTSAGDPRRSTYGTGVSMAGTLSVNNTVGTNSLESNLTKSQDATATLTSGGVVSNGAPVEGAFELGAGFGAKTDFKTNNVKFNKGELAAQLTLFYDSRRNLEKRGIQVASRETRYLSDLPQAFGGMGCTPPPGWKG